MRPSLCFAAKPWISATLLQTRVLGNKVLQAMKEIDGNGPRVLGKFAHAHVVA